MKINLNNSEVIFFDNLNSPEEEVNESFNDVNSTSEERYEAFQFDSAVKTLGDFRFASVPKGNYPLHVLTALNTLENLAKSGHPEAKKICGNLTNNNYI